MSRRLLPLVLAAALTGCATYDPAYHYGSRPATARLAGGAGRAGNVEALVLGVRDGADGPRAGIDVRLRVERSGAVPVSVPTDDLRLVTAGSVELAAGEIRTIGPSVPAAGGAATFVITFPLPGRHASASDLRGLTLHVPVDVDGRRETVCVDFEKSAPVYLWSDPWGWPGPDYSGRPTGWRQ